MWWFNNEKYEHYKKITTLGIFVSLAMIFSYVEVLIPFNFGIPGIKLGLANLVIVIGLYSLRLNEVLTISIIRILICGFFFGNGMSIIYSLAGGILSFIAMAIIRKVNIFSIVGVSVMGGVFHNVGQILSASIDMKTTVVAYYLPILMIAGTITGCLLGIIAEKILPIQLKIHNY